MTIERRWAWLAAALVLGATPAAALAEDCDASGNEAAIGQCASDDFAKTEETLDFTYRSVVDRLQQQDDAKKLFSAAQTAWLAYRDDECEFEAATSIGGSQHPMIVLQCKATLNRIRSVALRRLLTCATRDALCPIPPK